ncbi:uncharacterized protein VTP21DRAFT_5079 [Calcarisporiella thermophila]|uniref:uncharacterized protein n=1 Tax=Calcarisporiella thermophila TaxID=911321 RepID=UPI00374426D3
MDSSGKFQDFSPLNDHDAISLIQLLLDNELGNSQLSQTSLQSLQIPNSQLQQQKCQTVEPATTQLGIDSATLMKLIDERIARKLENSNKSQNAKESKRGSLKPVCEDMPTPEEIKKMSSKEKRQLRNKISARNFRVRRKEYITSLEEQIEYQKKEVAELREELRQAQEENERLRTEVENLRSEKETNTDDGMDILYGCDTKMSSNESSTGSRLFDLSFNNTPPFDQQNFISPLASKDIFGNQIFNQNIQVYSSFPLLWHNAEVEPHEDIKVKVDKEDIQEELRGKTRLELLMGALMWEVMMEEDQLKGCKELLDLGVKKNVFTYGDI